MTSSKYAVRRRLAASIQMCFHSDQIVTAFSGTFSRKRSYQTADKQVPAINQNEK
jgi:hypothetical protein